MSRESEHTRYVPPEMTRDCLDPWSYVELRVDGAVSLCCAREPIGNIAGQSLGAILRSEAAIRVRQDLLTGDLDEICRDCGLRGLISPSQLQKKVREHQESAWNPAEFDAAAYLKANPDIKAIAADPARHFLEWGRFEGRPLGHGRLPTPKYAKALRPLLVVARALRRLRQRLRHK